MGWFWGSWVLLKYIYLHLNTIELSLAVPLTNAMTLVISSMTGILLLGESKPTASNLQMFIIHFVRRICGSFVDSCGSLSNLPKCEFILI